MNGSQRNLVAPVVWEIAKATSGVTGTVQRDSTTGMPHPDTGA
jgi:hypothetical protein